MTSPYNDRDMGEARDHDQNRAGADTGELGAIGHEQPSDSRDADGGRLSNAAHEAGRLGQAAADRARGAADKARNATKRMQRGISTGADWVKEHDANEMWGEVQTLARKHPGKSMLAVAAIGFLVGRGVRRSR